MRTRNAMQLKAQIRNKAKDVGTTPQLMMQNYLLERIIERISLSHLRDNVVIKGGVLISSLVGVDKRSTYDLDATIQGLPLTHENAEIRADRRAGSRARRIHSPCPLKRNSVRFRRWHRQPPIRFRSGMGCGSGGVWALKLPLIWRRHWRRLCRAVK